MGLFDAVTDFVSDVAGEGLDLAGSDWGDAASWVSDQVESFGGGGGLLGGLDLDDAWGAAAQVATTVSSGADSGAIWDWAGSAIDEVSGTGFGTQLSGALGGSKGGLFGAVTSALDDPSSLLGTASDLFEGQLGEVNWLGDAAGVASGVLDGSGWSGLEDAASGVLGSAIGEVNEWGLEAVTDQLSDMGLPDEVLDIGGKLADGFDISDVAGLAESLGGSGVGQIVDTVGGLGDADLSELGQNLLGAAGADLPDSFDGLVSALDGGGVQNLLGELGGERLGGLMGSLSDTGLGDLVDKAIDGGAVTNLVEGLGGSGLADLAGKLDGGQVDAIVNGLSEDGVRTLLGQTLKGAAPASVPTAPDDEVFDDVVGTTADLAQTETFAELDGDLTEPMESVEPHAETLSVEIVELDALDEALDPVVSDTFEDALVVEEAPLDAIPDEFEEAVAVAEEFEEFEEAVAVADEIEESFTDDLFGDLE